jgi:hypothetical protein
MSSVLQGVSPKPHIKKIRKWLQDLEIMDTNRIPKQAMQYKPNGGRNTECPKKGRRDRLHPEG